MACGAYTTDRPDMVIGCCATIVVGASAAQVAAARKPRARGVMRATVMASRGGRLTRVRRTLRVRGARRCPGERGASSTGVGGKSRAAQRGARETMDVDR